MDDMTICPIRSESQENRISSKNFRAFLTWILCNFLCMRVVFFCSDEVKFITSLSISVYAQCWTISGFNYTESLK